MSIVRVNKRERYKSISNVPLNDARLTLEARGLLVHLLAQFDGWSVNIKALEKRAKKSSEGRLYKLFRELMEHGYCRRIDYKDGRGRAAGNEYQIFEEPIDDGLPPIIVLPDAVKPEAVKPGAVLPDQENPHHNKYEVLTNTKLTNTKNNNQYVAVVVPETWWPSEKIFIDLKMLHGFGREWVGQQVPTFIEYWNTRGEPLRTSPDSLFFDHAVARSKIRSITP